MNLTHPRSSWPGLFSLALLVASCDSSAPTDANLQVIGATLSTSVCKTASEGTTLRLSCPAGSTIQAVDFANYGLSSGMCGALIEQSGCHATT